MSADEVAAELRNSVYKATALTCSAGVAPNRLLAKVCSDINKPNGQFILPNNREAVLTFVSSLPIRKIGGIGKVTEHILRDVLGIVTCGEMLHKGAVLCALFSDSSADFFLSVGLGLGRTDTPENKMRKSISTEQTFNSTTDARFLFNKLEEIAETLSSDMQTRRLRGRTLTMKIKTSEFEVRTRAISLQKFIDSKEDILAHASKLLRAELPLSLRLIGLRMSQLQGEKDISPNPSQKMLARFLHLGESTSSENRSDSQLNQLDENNIPLSDEDDDESISVQNHVSSNDIDFSKGMSCSDSFSKLADAAMDSNDNEFTLSWLDGYKCSLCGIELPPEFKEERQEHSDFHLAAALHKEEQSGMRGASKKRKVWGKQGRSLPIDAFFAKVDKQKR